MNKNKLHIRLLAVPFCLLLLSCSGDKPVETIHQDDNNLYTAAISHNGKFALTVSKETTPKAWVLQPNNAQSIGAFPKSTHGENYSALAVSGDGAIAVTGEPNQVTVWEFASQKKLFSLKVYGDVLSLAVSENGKYILIGLNNYTANLYNVEKRRWVGSFKHENKINCVAISRDGQYLVTGSDDKTAMLFDIDKEKVLHVFKNKGKINTVAISPNNQYVLTSAAQQDSIIWDLKSHQKLKKLSYGMPILRKLKKPPLTITSARFSQNGKLLFTGNPPFYIRVWDVQSGEVIKTLTLPKKYFWTPSATIVYALAYRKNTNQLIAEASNGYAYRWKIHP